MTKTKKTKLESAWAKALQKFYKMQNKGTWKKNIKNVGRSEHKRKMIATNYRKKKKKSK